MIFTPVGVLFVTSVAFETLAALLIAAKTLYQPKKVCYVLFAFSMLTLPASIVNVLYYQNIVSSHWNSFAYLVSTLFMLTIHFWLTLDIGKHLRSEGIQYKSPFVVGGAIGLVLAMACLITQIVLLFIRDREHPARPLFISGVCLAIISDGATYTYSFSSLIRLKSQRLHEGQSRTTALGVWFLFIQFVWYIVYGVLYVWFFCNMWEVFHVLLVFDYFLRFVLCLMFTWPPPNFVISFMSGHFFSGTSGKENSHQDENASTFAITDVQKNSISFGHDQQKAQKYTHDDLESAKEDIFYSSNVAIVMKSQ